MKQQSLETLEYSEKDIADLIYEDICKQYPKTLRQRVKIGFSIGSDPSDNDYQSMPRQILNGASVTVDITK